VKWVFLAGLLITTCALIAILKNDRRRLPAAAFCLGLLPFIEAKFHLLAAPVSWPAWLGQSKGFEVSLADGVAFAILLATRKTRAPGPLKAAMAVVICAYLVSTIATGARTETLFVGWEIIRNIIVYLAVLRVIMTDERALLAIFTGMVTGLAIQAVVVISQMASGAIQASGWLGHQNLLGFACHFCVYPALAAFLGGYYPKRTGLTVLAGVIVAFAGASRATIGLLVIGMFLTLVFSIWHRTSGRKSALVGGALLGLLIIAPVLYSAIDRRTVEQREGSTEAREGMKAAARLIISDFPLGIGANRYVVVANVGGYSERVGLPWDPGSRGAPVHNSYYLMTAEMGWIGLVGLISLLSAAFWMAVRALRQLPSSFAGELAAGTAVSVLMVATHAYYEWIFFHHIVQTMLAACLGIASALYVMSRRQTAARHPRLAWAASARAGVTTG
jgi:hypothetical protein